MADIHTENILYLTFWQPLYLLFFKMAAIKTNYVHTNKTLQIELLFWHQNSQYLTSAVSTCNSGVIVDDNFNFRQHIFLVFIESVIIIFVIYGVKFGISFFLVQTNYAIVLFNSRLDYYNSFYYQITYSASHGDGVKRAKFHGAYLRHRTRR